MSKEAKLNAKKYLSGGLLDAACKLRLKNVISHFLELIEHDPKILECVKFTEYEGNRSICVRGICIERKQPTSTGSLYKMCLMVELEDGSLPFATGRGLIKATEALKYLK